MLLYMKRNPIKYNVVCIYMCMCGLMYSSWFFILFLNILYAIIKRKKPNDVISNERKSTNDLQKRWFFFMANLFLFLFQFFFVGNYFTHTHIFFSWSKKCSHLLSSRRHCQSSFQNNYNKKLPLLWAQGARSAEAQGI